MKSKSLFFLLVHVNMAQTANPMNAYPALSAYLMLPRCNFLKTEQCKRKHLDSNYTLPYKHLFMCRHIQDRQSIPVTIFSKLQI